MLRGLIVVAVTGLALATAGSAAAADRAFTVRFTANDTGDIAMAANTLMTCPAPVAGCAAAQAGAADNNNNYTMGYVDVDSDASTFDSSTADLTLPAGATVLFAGLYWGGDTSAGTNGAVAPSAAARGSVLMQVPGGSYAAVSAATLDDSTAQASRYQGFADVTAAVAAAGGGTYTVANVQAGTGQDRYAGWSLVVAYHDQAQAPRNLTVFDGLRTVSAATPALDIPVSGFFTPVSGQVNTTLGFVAWEGDRGLVGDTAALDATTLSDAANPATNFFNSSIADKGSNVTTKSPDYVNQLAFDSDLLDASGILGNGASAATIHLSTVGDTYLPGMVSFATDLYSPRLTPGKTAVDLNGGAVLQGDVIEYSVTATNTGQDGASDVVVTDPIPAHTSYVPGSLQVVSSPGGIAGAKTDATGDDQAEETGGGVRFRLGAGATSAAGGTIEPGESYEVRFQVRIDTPTAPGTVIVNRAQGTYSAETHPSLDLTDISLPTQLTIVAPDLVIAKTDSGLVRGSTGSFTLSVSNNGGGATAGTVTVTDTVPPSLPVTGASGTGWSCSTAGQAVTCTRADALAAGAAYPDITVGVTVAQSAPSSVVNTAHVANAGDGDTSNNDGSDTATVTSSSDLAIVKSVRPATPVAGRRATFTLLATNNGPSNATGVTVTDPLPAQLTGTAVSTTAGTCALLAGTVTCTIPNLASGASATITIRGTVDPSAAGATLANTAGISGDQPDPDSSNDSDSVSPTITGLADLGVVKTMTPADPIVGEPVSFRIAVSNHGPSDATGVTVSDPLPAQIAGATVTPSQGSCVLLAGTVTCTLGTLAPGAAATVTVSGTIAPATGGQIIANTAQVQGNETDPDLSNNIANTSGRIEETSLRVRKTASTTSTVPAGSKVSYTISVKVTGPAAATDVDACDHLPLHTSFVDIDGATLTAGAACWHFASIAAGATETRTVVVRIDADAPTGSLRNLLVVHAGNAASGSDGATVGVEATPTTSIPIVTG